MITEANINNPPKAIFSVIGSPINIIDVIAPKRISVDRIREAVEDGTYFWEIVWTKYAINVLQIIKNPIADIWTPFILVVTIEKFSKIIFKTNVSNPPLNIWKAFITIGFLSFINAPITAICKAKNRADTNVNRSPYPMLKSPSSDKNPIPIKHIIDDI